MIMKSNKGGGLEKQKARWAWLFIAPWIVGIAVFFRRSHGAIGYIFLL